METRIPLSTAALRLGLTYHQCRARLLSGELPGGRDEYGRFYVDAKAVPDDTKPRPKTLRRKQGRNREP